MTELARMAVLLAGLMAVPPADGGREQTGAPVTGQPATDPWFGADKFRHFGMSYAATSFAFAAARAGGADTGPALQLAIPVSAAAGIAKEIHDRRGGGVFSLRDLVANAVGMSAAYFLLREVR